MSKIELPPTKSSLRRLSDDLAFAYEGYDLLNQKREILAMEIVRHISEVRRVEASFLRALNSLYAAYRRAASEMGSSVITTKSCSEKRAYYLHRDIEKVMGLKLPKTRIGKKAMRPVVTMNDTTSGYDDAKNRSISAVDVLAEYAGMTKAIIMLSRELKKVIRRVNALEKIFIPQHEEARKYITDRIEEMEREEVFVKKLVRQRSSRR